MTDQDALAFRTFIRKYGADGVLRELIHVCSSYTRGPHWRAARGCLVRALGHIGQRIHSQQFRRRTKPLTQVRSATYDSN